ncbi:hypothetical protein ASD65_10975 [Microbacterium sp. Root61]|uniref:hypothetical protein n=1 Tax=Microbacterium sp. Root61 TaxID=1736570 RepID=UPI0006F318E1|nr:hypothetical protein [Microbacterium sp. Root61]KRA24891.1 hypothetical protein ASD65_10975 [Microbacterium sp. Root61]
MTTPTDKTIAQAADTAHATAENLTASTRKVAAQVGDTFTDVAEKTGNFTTDTIARVRAAYTKNPVRTISITAACTISLIGIVMAIARRN